MTTITARGEGHSVWCVYHYGDSDELDDESLAIIIATWRMRHLWSNPFR